MRTEVSVVIPAHNIERTLAIVVSQVVDELRKFRKPYEIIIAEDGSTDGTLRIAKSLSKKYDNIKVLSYKNRLGKGCALSNSLQKANGRLRIFIDGDYVDVAKHMPKMLEMLKTSDVVIGSRYKKSSNSKRLFIRLVVSKIYINLAKTFLSLPFSDMQCGFKGMNDSLTGVLSEVKSKDYFWDTEFLFKARKNGNSIHEIPIDWVEKKSKHSTSIVAHSFKFIKSLVKLRLGLL